MKDWWVSFNDEKKTAKLHVEEKPWFWSVIDSLFFTICDLMPEIDLPKIKCTDDEGNVTTLDEYYGSYRDLFHIFVHDVIFQFCNRKFHKYSEKYNYFYNSHYPIYIDYEEAKQIFVKEWFYHQKYDAGNYGPENAKRTLKWFLGKIFRRRLKIGN